MKITKSKATQIRLLLPEEWVPELDNLAATRFLSRLGFLRFLIRNGMNQELSNLAEHFKQTELQRKTHQKLKQHRQDKEW